MRRRTFNCSLLSSNKQTQHFKAESSEMKKNKNEKITQIEMKHMRNLFKQQSNISHMDFFE